MLKAKSCRLHWNAELGWLLDVPTTISAQQLWRVAKWALPRQVERYHALPPGDRKDELRRALDLLKAGKIRQQLVDHDGDGVLVPFTSTEKVTTKEYSYG